MEGSRIDGGTSEGREESHPAETRLLAACLECGNICLCIVTDGGTLKPYGTAGCPDCDGMDFDPDAVA